jgi:hypothetical protein
LSSATAFRRGLRDLIFLQKIKGLRQARVAFGRALRDRSDRRADGLLRARPSHWIFSQQQFDQSVLRG